MLTPESLLGDLATYIPSSAHHRLAQAMELPGDVSVGENYQSDAFGLVKEERDCSLEEVNDYMIEMEKHENTLREEDVAMKAMSRSAIDLGRSLNRLAMEKSFLMKTKKELVLCSS